MLLSHTLTVWAAQHRRRLRPPQVVHRRHHHRLHARIRKPPPLGRQHMRTNRHDHNVCAETRHAHQSLQACRRWHNQIAQNGPMRVFLEAIIRARSAFLTHGARILQKFFKRARHFSSTYPSARVPPFTEHSPHACGHRYRRRKKKDAPRHTCVCFCLHAACFYQCRRRIRATHNNLMCKLYCTASSYGARATRKPCGKR